LSDLFPNLERVGCEPLWGDIIVTVLDNPDVPVLLELHLNVQQLKLKREGRLNDQSQVNNELIRNSPMKSRTRWAAFAAPRSCWSWGCRIVI